MPFFTDSTEVAVEGVGAARRIGWMRFVGNGLGALPIASIILERQADAAPWVLLLLNAIAWPALAMLLTRRAREPAAAQFRCMIVDSLFGGAWVAFMALSTVPSALFAALLVADKIAAGGIRLATRATLALVVGFAATWLALGLPYHPITSPGEIAEPPTAAPEPDGSVGGAGQPRLPDPARPAGAADGAAPRWRRLPADA